MAEHLDIEENLQLFARWESVVPYFSLRERGQNDPYVRVIKPMLERLEKVPGVEVKEVISLPSNYYGFFAYPEGKPAGTFRGLTAYLSLLAPVAVIGRTNMRKQSSGEVYLTSLLIPTVIISPNDTRNEVEETVVQEIHASGYTFLSKADVDKPLPENVVIRHHSQPDKRYFHAIFDYDEDY